MTVSPSVGRKQLHTREIKCIGYERDDGLWDIEGRITDTKTYSYDNEDRGIVISGSPVHDMIVRLTIDENLLVHEAEAHTLSSPFNICPNIANSIETLRGLKISSGWRKSVRDKIGGTNGCTHITQLLIGPLATTAYQTIVPLKRHPHKNKNPSRRPSIIDTCYGWSAKGPIVKRFWPQYYKETE